jgi:hypothetical protein
VPSVLARPYQRRGKERLGSHRVRVDLGEDEFFFQSYQERRSAKRHCYVLNKVIPIINAET